MTQCIKCNKTIPLIRLLALPNATTCVGCSAEKEYVGFMDWEHKTAPEIVFVRGDDRENLRRAKAINERKR
jgi:Prokaryotic dksA/traR C4-type zinc finger